MVSVTPCEKIDCPSEATLTGLLAGGANPPQHDDVAEHVGSCPTCQTRLESMAVGDEAELAAVVRGMGDEEPPPNSAYWLALNRAEGALSESAATQGFGSAIPASEVNLDFLSQTGVTGALGRISTFAVKSVIGRGGMGIVLQAFDSSLHRDVAIKVLDPQLASNDVARQRFCREARAAAAVAHDNLVTVFQVDEDFKSGLPFIVMQLVVGESLEQKLKRVSTISVVEAVRLGMQCAAGLASSHAAGLIHRDIKPGNILLEAGTDKAKLTDFGLARAVEDDKLTRTGFVAGTPLYMAPEQARGDDIDARADLFSLGSVLYEALAGKPPFEGRTPLAVLRRVADEAHTPLSAYNPSVPEWLEDAIDRLLAKFPADRFQTASELSELFAFHYAAIKDLTPLQVPAVDCGGSRSITRLWSRGRKKFCVRTASMLASVFGAGVITGSVAAWLVATRVHEVSDRSPLAALNRAAGVEASAPAAKPDEGPDSLMTFPGNTGSVWSVSTSADGTTLATGIESGRINVWDVATQSLRYELHRDDEDKLPAHTGPVWLVEISADGRTMVSVGDDGTVKNWDLLSGKLLPTSMLLNRSIRTAAVGPKGHLVALGDRLGVVEVRDIEKGTSLLTRDTGSAVLGVAFSPDGELLAFGGGDGAVTLWDIKLGRKRNTWQASQSPIYSLHFSPDGAQLVTAGWGKEANVWSVADGTRVGLPLQHDEDVWAVKFSPCSKFVATGSQDGKTRLFDLSDGGKLVRTYARHKASVHSLRFADNGAKIVTGSRDGSVRVWPSGKPGTN